MKLRMKITLSRRSMIGCEKRMLRVVNEIPTRETKTMPTRRCLTSIGLNQKTFGLATGWKTEGYLYSTL